jgi:hypothetical protein
MVWLLAQARAGEPPELGSAASASEACRQEVKAGVRTCAWILRDGSPCMKVAQIGELCPPHFEMQQALDAATAERAARGGPPMSARERDRFLKRLSHARRAAKRRAVR